MSETIEERAKRICKRLDYIDAWNAGGEEAIELIEDLMAERGKMKERIEKAQGELVELSEALDAWGHPATAGQLMGIYDILEDK